MKNCDSREKSPAPSKAIRGLSNHTSSPDSAASKQDVEGFKALATQFAPTGHSLHFDKHSNSFYAERWGQIRDFATLDDARRFLVQIGGEQ